VLLNDLLSQPEFRAAGITKIGNWRTTITEYVVLGPAGEPVFPIDMEKQHPIAMKDGNENPEVSEPEAESIRRRFRLSGFRSAPY
jgi:hypothetical protein